MAANYTGPAPYGFRWQNGQLAIEPGEAETRRLAFKLFPELGSKGAVARELNSRGLRTRRGSKWRDVSIDRMLRCPSARGLYPINKTVVDGDGKRVSKPESEWDYLQCESIVSEEAWTRAADLLAREASATGPAPATLFAGVVKCVCGTPMHLTSSTRRYACAKCRNGIPPEDLEALFLDEVTGFLKKRKAVFASLLDGGRDQLETRSELEARLRELGETEAELSKVEKLYMGKRIPHDRFEAMYRPLEDRRRELKQQIERLKAKLPKKESSSEEEKPLAFKPSDFREQWPKIDLQTKRAVISALLTRVVVDDDKVEFAYLFSDAPQERAKPPRTERPANTGDHGDEPLYIRLPPPGKKCPRTGLTRSMINELILPTPRNGYSPPVESKSLGPKGTRLIVWASLKTFLESR